MSQEKVENVRRHFEAFNEGGQAAASEFWDPAIVWHTDPLVPERGVYTGVEAVRTYLDGFIRAFGAWHIDVHRLIDLGGDEVFSELTMGGSPLGQTDQETQFFNWCQIISVREGRLVRIRSFFDRAKALEAVGLSE